MSGTTAAAIWTPARIIMAADSKVTRRNDANVVEYSACKTRIVGAYAITDAGMFARPNVGFDAWELLESTLTSVRSLTEIERRRPGAPVKQTMEAARQRQWTKHESQPPPRGPDLVRAP
jgi:hypothetical protein